MDLALLPETESSLVKAFGLERFSIGVQRPEGDQGERYRTEVKRLWPAVLLPSFHPKAYLSVLYSDRGRFCLCCKGGIDGHFGGKPVRMHDWEDPLAAALSLMDLFPTEGGLALDGIGYSLHIQTTAVTCGISFSNPRTDSLRRIERSLFSTANDYVRISQDSEMRDYLLEMGRYCRAS
jgi:hypothetical protein